MNEINESFSGGLTQEALAEALHVAAELTDKPCVAARLRMIQRESM